MNFFDAFAPRLYGQAGAPVLQNLAPANLSHYLHRCVLCILVVYMQRPGSSQTGQRHLSGNFFNKGDMKC